MRFMRLARVILTTLLFALVLNACVPTGAVRSPAEIAAAQHASALAQQGQFDQAAQAWLQLATQSSAHADSYRLQAAEAWRQEGRIEQAAPVLGKIRRERLNGDEPLRLDLLRAELALDQHDARTALRLTSQPNVSVPPSLQTRLLELRARAMKDSGDLWGAARTRVQMDAELQGFDQAQNRRQALDLLAKLGIAPLQHRAAAMKPGDHMLPWISEALRQLGVSVAQPQPELQQAVGMLLPEAGANVREGYKVPAQVALLLPADGDYAAASTPIRQGFFAAYFDAGRNHAPRPTVRSYNSHGTADGAVQAYQQAVRDGARLVIGPLTRGEVAAVFALPQLPVPVLALNHPDDRQLPAGNASEFGLLPETEGAQVADHMAERGLLRAYVMISGDDFAQRAADAFKAELVSRGGEVIATTVLPTGASSFADTIKNLQLPTTSAAPVAAGTADAAAEPAGAGDTGIFISMRPNQARLLMPQLRIAQVGLPVFATSHVYAGGDDVPSNRDLDGVEFCDAPWLFDAQPGLPDRAAIAAKLPAARDGAARLFAFGMDAWGLVPYLDWLKAHPGSYMPGATGQLAADPFGRIRRVLTWAKFENGVARPLSGNLQIDTMPSPPAEPAPASSSADGNPAG
ncbi:penicillin-binding protein activator [Rhodanobacter lindaniclasticus]|uniref:Penicillin-binding protein activator n=1 Tax=Rhodanobacter lindaniclasticus TaxID=75310 RepID=A0A4S3KG23_9GAMM|nr:penicillin-binding protein activator [Rhodanobacter lindaniclasticus]THD07585.1 penicillin-binding protein activator [Rhodanobacter lindaniclasticus]